MSDDLISRQAAIDSLIDDLYDLLESDMVNNDFIREGLMKVPSVQSKTGRWILDTTQFLPEYVCTNCKSRFPLVASEGNYSTLCCKNMNYCPNCGAKMEGETE